MSIPVGHRIWLVDTVVQRAVGGHFPHSEQNQKGIPMDVVVDERDHLKCRGKGEEFLGMSDLRRAGRHKQPHRPLPRPMSSPDESHPLVGSPSPIDLTNGRASATMKVAAVAHFAEQADAGLSWQTCINVATCSCKWAAELRNPLC